MMWTRRDLPGIVPTSILDLAARTDGCKAVSCAQLGLSALNAHKKVKNVSENVRAVQPHGNLRGV